MINLVKANKENQDQSIECVKPYSIKVIEVPSVNSNLGKLNILSSKHKLIVVRASCEFGGSTESLKGQIESCQGLLSSFEITGDHEWLIDRAYEATGLKLDLSGSPYVQRLGAVLKLTIVDVDGSIPEGDFDLFQIYSEDSYPHDAFEKLMVLGATRALEEKQYYVRDFLWGKAEDGIVIDTQGSAEFQFNQHL